MLQLSKEVAVFVARHDVGKLVNVWGVRFGFVATPREIATHTEDFPDFLRAYVCGFGGGVLDDGVGFSPSRTKLKNFYTLAVNAVAQIKLFATFKHEF